MISLLYTSHTKAYNTIYTACNIVEAIYSFRNSEWLCQWDPVASHSRSTEKLLLAQKYLSDVAGTSREDQA